MEFNLLCKPCGTIFAVPEGAMIQCPICQQIYDMKGNRYSNNFAEGDIVEYWDPQLELNGNGRGGLYRQAIFVKPSLHKHYSIVRCHHFNIELETIARYAVNPHID